MASTALVVLIFAIAAMPVVVSAADLKILPEGIITLIPGSYVDTTAQLTDLQCDGGSRTFKADVVYGDSVDITFKVTDPWSSITVGTGGSVIHTYTPPSGTTGYDIKVEILTAQGAVDEDYTFYYQDVQTGKFDTATGSTPGHSVPEFGLIALPIASMLGLFFFFYKRRKG